MGLRSLDHVALWTEHRDSIAAVLVEKVGMHVIERTDAFTLVGADARRGKLTLFEADGPRRPGVLQQIGLSVPRLSGVPGSLELADGLRIELEASDVTVADLDHVALRCVDPERATEGWRKLGLVPRQAIEGVASVGVGEARIELHESAPFESGTPLLNHLGVLVDSAEEWRASAEDHGFEIADIKDAPNTYAVFVRGPEDVVIEFVEHKPSFSLV